MSHEDDGTIPAEAAGLSDATERGRTISLGILATLAVAYTLKLAAALILPFIIAAVLNLVLQPAKHLLHHRLRVPAPLAALALILVLFGIAGGLGAALSVPASGWIARAPDGVKLLEKRLHGLAGPIHYAERGVHELESLLREGQAPAHDVADGAAQQSPAPPAARQGQDSSPNLIGTIGSVGLSVLQGTGAAMGQLLTLLVLLFFMLSAGDTLLRRLVEVMPTYADKRRVVEIAQEIEDNVSGYLATISLMNILVGTANGLSMWLLGVSDPLLWGTLAFLLNYVPILGPFFGIVIFFFVGLFSFNSLWMAALPGLIYLVIHVIEGETVTPMLLANRFTLNPVLVIGSLFFWDYIWGVIGALLAVPLLAVSKIICDRVDPLKPLGHLLGGAPDRGARAHAADPPQGDAAP